MSDRRGVMGRAGICTTCGRFLERCDRIDCPCGGFLRRATIIEARCGVATPDVTLVGRPLVAD